MHLSLCCLFSQYSKEIRNDTEHDEYVEDNDDDDDDDDCKRGRKRGRKKKRIMMVEKKKRGAQCKNFCLLIGYCEPGSKPSMLYNLWSRH